MNIKQFDKPTCRALGLEVEQAMAAIAKKHGLKASYGGGSFDPSKFTCRLVLELSGDNPNAEVVERAKFAQWCQSFGLTAADYGVTIQSNRFGRLTLIGFEPGRPKFPVVCRKEDGSVALYTREMLRMLKDQRLTA